MSTGIMRKKWPHLSYRYHRPQINVHLHIGPSITSQYISRRFYIDDKPQVFTTQKRFKSVLSHDYHTTIFELDALSSTITAPNHAMSLQAKLLRSTPSLSCESLSYSSDPTRIWRSICIGIQGISNQNYGSYRSYSVEHNARPKNAVNEAQIQKFLTKKPVPIAKRTSSGDNDLSSHRLEVPTRQTKEELLLAATGFWSRLKVRFKWFSIRSVRPWNVDDWSAFVSWFVLGNILWVLVGTTTFFSLVIFSINTVVAQGTRLMLQKIVYKIN